MNYVYIQSEPQLYTVGFYQPDGKWIAESDWPESADAAKRVIELNGEANAIERRLDSIEKQLEALANALITVHQFIKLERIDQ